MLRTADIIDDRYCHVTTEPVEFGFWDSGVAEQFPNMAANIQANPVQTRNLALQQLALRLCVARPMVAMPKFCT
jgi:hypothetical protein